MDPDSSVDLIKKHIFGIPGFFIPKVTPDSDAGRSPTSPLDLGVFGGPSRAKWVSDKVGLSVLGVESDSFTRDNLVLAPQIKSTAMLSTDPPQESNYNPRRSSSSQPMDIVSTQAYSRSLSGREMALSEDYTCIISHGPNPKTTHIFGDCILDCDPKEETEKTRGQSLSTNNSRLCLRVTQDCHKKSHIHREVSAAAAADMEIENGGVDDSLDISPGSSYNGDLCPPMATHE